MRPCSMRKIAPLSRNAQHSNAANHLNLQGNVLAFCAECTNTEAFTKKLQAFSVIVLTLLGAAFCQRELILQALTPNRLIRHLRTSLEPRWDRVYRCTFDSFPRSSYLASNPSMTQKSHSQKRDCVRIVPLATPELMQRTVAAQAARLVYNNGPLIAQAQVFTIFWGTGWQ